MYNLSAYLNEGQDSKLAEKVLQKLADLLFNDEEIIYLAIQKKTAINLLPDAVVVCTRRIFYCTASNLGLTMNFKDISWKNIKDLGFKEGILSNKFICMPIAGEDIVTDFIPKTQIRKLYQAALEQLENYRNSLTNTVNKIESSCVEQNDIVAEENTELETPIISDNSIEQKLLQLKQLYEKQLISREEYEVKKASILEQL